MEWNGSWNGLIEWNGMKWNGMEGMEWGKGQGERPPD
jgi:hypothetical protein